MITSQQQAEDMAQELMRYMMDTKMRRCLCCSFSLSKSNHQITRGMVEGLVKFANHCINTRTRYVNPRTDLWIDNKLSINEMINWTKLRFFGLVAKYLIDGRHVGGKWVITRRGWAFLRGEEQIPRHVKTFRNRIVEKSIETIGIADILESVQYFPSREDFPTETVDADDLAVVAEYTLKKTGKKKKIHKCSVCVGGKMIRRMTADIVKNIAVPKYWLQCNKCGHREDVPVM